VSRDNLTIDFCAPQFSCLENFIWRYIIFFCDWALASAISHAVNSREKKNSQYYLLRWLIQAPSNCSDEDGWPNRFPMTSLRVLLLNPFQQTQQQKNLNAQRVEKIIIESAQLYVYSS
jgi:hypothetical protein